MQEIESIVEEERRVAEDARQALVLLEKKRIALQTELDDLHVALENVRVSIVNVIVRSPTCFYLSRFSFFSFSLLPKTSDYRHSDMNETMAKR